MVYAASPVVVENSRASWGSCGSHTRKAADPAKAAHANSATARERSAAANGASRTPSSGVSCIARSIDSHAGSRPAQPGRGTIHKDPCSRQPRDQGHRRTPPSPSSESPTAHRNGSTVRATDSDRYLLEEPLGVLHPCGLPGRCRGLPHRGKIIEPELRNQPSSACHISLSRWRSRCAGSDARSPRRRRA